MCLQRQQCKPCQQVLPPLMVFLFTIIIKKTEKKTFIKPLFQQKNQKKASLSKAKILLLKMFELNCQWPVSLLMFRNLSAGGEYIVWQLLIRNIGFLCKQNFYNPLT